MRNKIIFAIFIILILGSIVLLISVYLINSIAINILKPIKMMNSILIGINKTIEKEKEGEGLIELKNSQKIQNENLNNYQKLYDEENEYENEDDDLLDIRSQDIDQLFRTLIDLKKSLNYLQNNENQENESKMLNLIFAINTFKNVNSQSPELLLCNSNIGNLSIKLKKYDRAVMHLWESIKFDEDANKNKNKNDELMNCVYNQINLEKKTDKIRFFENGNKNETKLELEKKINLESRLPKIIFAFKKYFKEINSLVKNLVYDERIRNIDLTKSIVNNKLEYKSNMEFYYINRGQLINNYLNSDFITDNYLYNLTRFSFVLYQYDLQNKDNNPRIKILYEFENLEFLIKFVLRPLEYKYENMKSYKENFDSNLKLFMDNLYDYDKINKDLTNDYKDLHDKLKKVREKIKDEIELCKNKIKEDNKDSTERFLVAKKLSKKIYLEYTDLPKSVLIQRCNLIEGKFLYKNDLSKSFKILNSILLQEDDIIDANILRSALKYMKKIFGRIQELFKSFKNNEEALKQIKHELANENKNNQNELLRKQLTGINNVNNFNITNETAINYLQNLSDKAEDCINKYNEELQKFKIEKKDIAVLIDFNKKILMKEKNKEKSERFYEEIFHEFCTFNDRIALFGYEKNPFQLQSLIEKNNKTTKLIEKNSKDFFSNEDSSSNFVSEEDTESELVKAIEYVYNNIGKKDIYNNRQKWIIVLTDEISEKDLNKFKDDFSKKIYGSKKNENLIIMKYKFDNNESKEKKIMESALEFNNSKYLELDKKPQLKYKMKTYGIINESNVFDNENYNS